MGNFGGPCGLWQLGKVYIPRYIINISNLSVKTERGNWARKLQNVLQFWVAILGLVLGKFIWVLYDVEVF